MTLEASEKMNTKKSIYRRGKSAEAHETSILDNALVKADIPDAEHDKDRYFGE